MLVRLSDVACSMKSLRPMISGDTILECLILECGVSTGSGESVMSNLCLVLRVLGVTNRLGIGGLSFRVLVSSRLFAEIAVGRTGFRYRRLGILSLISLGVQVGVELESSSRDMRMLRVVSPSDGVDSLSSW